MPLSRINQLVPRAISRLPGTRCLSAAAGQWQPRSTGGYNSSNNSGGGGYQKAYAPQGEPLDSAAGEDGPPAFAGSKPEFGRGPAPQLQPMQAKGLAPFPDEAQQSEVALPPPATGAFPTDVQAILAEPVNPADVEIKPDGVCYLPEIRYRKTLLRAFGPGGWCLLPRGPHTQNGAVLSREYALVCHGQYVSQARGSTTIASFSNAALASEAVRSNALMRCCKDLGIAAELWDAAYIGAWKENYGLKRAVSDAAGRQRILWSKKE